MNPKEVKAIQLKPEQDSGPVLTVGGTRSKGMTRNMVTLCLLAAIVVVAFSVLAIYQMRRVRTDKKTAVGTSVPQTPEQKAYDAQASKANGSTPPSQPSSQPQAASGAQVYLLPPPEAKQEEPKAASASANTKP
jgi:cytoskeletal protein RodZ